MIGVRVVSATKPGFLQKGGEKLRRPTRQSGLNEKGPDPSTYYFSHRIQQRRIARGLSESDLADRLPSVRDAHARLVLKNVLQGIRLPHPDWVAEIASALDLRIEELWEAYEQDRASRGHAPMTHEKPFCLLSERPSCPSGSAD